MRRAILLAATMLAAIPPAAGASFYLSMHEARRAFHHIDRDFAATQPDIIGWHVDDCFRVNNTTVNCRNRFYYSDGSTCWSRDIVYYQQSSGMERFRHGHSRCA